MRIAAALASLLLLAAAGCVAPGSPGPDGPEGGRDRAGGAPPAVFRTEGSVGASGPFFAVGSQGYAFQVGPNVTLLLAEIVWDDPAQDLDLALASPEAGMTGTAQTYDHRAEGGSPGAPDSPHGLAVDMPETGDWQAAAFGNGASALVDYRIAITLFHGETEVPAGYSALG